MRKIIHYVALIMLFLSGFLDIPYISTSWFRLFLLIYIYINSKKITYLLEEKIQEFKTDINVEGIQVYELPYERIKSHNAMIIKGKKYNIVIEEELMDTLTQEQLEAVLYHEVGHTHTIGVELINIICLIGLYFNITALYEALYGNAKIINYIFGIGLVAISVYLRKFIEYKADKYAVECGVDMENLISAIECIDKMNGKVLIETSNHPSIEKRRKKLQKVRR